MAIIIGANDVVNPAIKYAENSPIYSIPVLSADEAKHVVTCNYDLKPGYSDVENPLFKVKNLSLLLGDSADKYLRPKRR